ncbi:MAG: DUF4097 family beta strand repeat-containing protein [Acidimicrobiales bacterium]
MPTFDTPTPISVTMELGVGDIRIVASDRRDTVVEVRPSDDAKKPDVSAADRTGVEFAEGELVIKGPKGWRHFGVRSEAEAITVKVELPSGSQLQGQTGVAVLHATGRLGECHYKTGVGDIHIDRAGPLHLRSGSGDIAVGEAGGPTEVTTGSGSIRIGRIDGTAVVKNSNGDTSIGVVTGDLRVNAANGTIVVDRAQATVEAKTANGDLCLREVARGEVLAQTALGKVDIGVLDGVTAYLDLDTRFGSVHNELDSVERPEAGGDTVEVRARTAIGDVTVRRSLAHDAGPIAL